MHRLGSGPAFIGLRARLFVERHSEIAHQNVAAVGINDECITDVFIVCEISGAEHKRIRSAVLNWLTVESSPGTPGLDGLGDLFPAIEGRCGHYGNRRRIWVKTPAVLFVRLIGPIRMIGIRRLFHRFRFPSSFCLCLDWSS